MKTPHLDKLLNATKITIKERNILRELGIKIL